MSVPLEFLYDETYDESLCRAVDDVRLRMEEQQQRLHLEATERKEALRVCLQDLLTVLREDETLRLAMRELLREALA